MGKGDLCRKFKRCEEVSQTRTAPPKAVCIIQQLAHVNMPDNATGAEKNSFSGGSPKFKFDWSGSNREHQQVVEVVASSGVATTVTALQREDASTQTSPSRQAAALPFSPQPPQLTSVTSANEAAAAATLRAMQEEQRSKTAEAAGVVRLLLLIFAVRLNAQAGRAGKALSNKFAGASATTAAAAAWITSSRVTSISQSVMQSSKEAWTTYIQYVYALTCQVTLSAGLQMLCISFWVLAMCRQPTYVSTSLNSMSAVASCVCASLCIALTAGAAFLKLKPIAAAAWLLVTSMAVRQLQRLSEIGNTSVCSSAMQFSANPRSFLTELQSYGQAWWTGLVQLPSTLLSRQHLLFVGSLVLVWAASISLPSLAFDCLVSALINSWPAALVLLWWKVRYAPTQPSLLSCCESS